VRGIDDLERRNDRASRQRVDLEAAAGQLVDPVGEELEGILRRRRIGNRGLHLERAGLLRERAACECQRAGHRRDEYRGRKRTHLHE